MKYLNTEQVTQILVAVIQTGHYVPALAIVATVDALLEVEKRLSGEAINTANPASKHASCTQPPIRQADCQVGAQPPSSPPHQKLVFLGGYQLLDRIEQFQAAIRARE